MHVSHSFVFSALPLLTLAIPTVQPPASRGFSIPVTKHVKDTFNRDPVKLATYEIMKSLATQKAMNIHQNNTGMADSYADGNETSANLKRGAGGVPLTGYALSDDGGKPEEYFVRIGVGGQEFHATLMTGMSDLFLLSQDCNSCGNRNKYTPSSRFAVSIGNGNFKFLFGGHTLHYNIYSDSVQFAGQFVPWHSFGVAMEISPELPIETFPADGLLGLGLQPTGGDIMSPSVIQSLINSARLNKPIYGLTLADKVAELFLGDYPPRAGNIITWVRAQHNNKGVWKMPIEKITMGVKGGEEFIVVKYDELEVYLNMGQTAIIVGTDLGMTQIFKHIDGAIEDKHDKVHYIPCNSKSSIFVYIRGTKFEITPEAFSLGRINGAPEKAPCLGSAIRGRTGEWTLGVPFFKSIYAMFNVDSNEVGIANIISAS